MNASCIGAALETIPDMRNGQFRSRSSASDSSSLGSCPFSMFSIALRRSVETGDPKISLSFFIPPDRIGFGFLSRNLNTSTEMMCAHTGFHPDQARPHVGKPRFYLTTRPFLSQHNGTALIVANNMKRVFADIDSDHGDR